MVLMDLGFLDHLLREDPSKRMIAIKRSFFHPKITARASIGGGVEAMKGVYQSIRAAQVCHPRIMFGLWLRVLTYPGR